MIVSQQPEHRITHCSRTSVCLQLDHFCMYLISSDYICNSIDINVSDICTPMFTAELLKRVKQQKQSKCPSVDDQINKVGYTQLPI